MTRTTQFEEYLLTLCRPTHTYVGTIYENIHQRQMIACIIVHESRHMLEMGSRFLAKTNVLVRY